MAVWIALGLVMLLSSACSGQNGSTTQVPTSPTTVPAASDIFCKDKQDFEPCARSSQFKQCSSAGSCYCRQNQPYCRCHNYNEGSVEFWYLGQGCDQLWSTTTLILVTTLPALALALLVGVLVQCVHYWRTPEDRQHRKEIRHTQKGIPPQLLTPDNVYSNPIFTHEPEVFDRHIENPFRMSLQRPQAVNLYPATQEAAPPGMSYSYQTHQLKAQPFYPQYSGHPPSQTPSQTPSHPPSHQPRNPYTGESDDSEEDYRIRRPTLHPAGAYVTRSMLPPPGHNKSAPDPGPRAMPKGAVPIFPPRSPPSPTYPTSENKAQMQFPRPQIILQH
ncbi:uncharacterized protein LOC136760088 [Amia ocellicauda]|uniref:uncharacterized protein LOC136760088 n=1 Tax=Amia ocellicauda TaxID=2972642 RepID=UPI00346401FE